MKYIKYIIMSIWIFKPKGIKAIFSLVKTSIKDIKDSEAHSKKSIDNPGQWVWMNKEGDIW